ncbi:MAG TPA: DUF3467 domain-containing protein [Burkholderiales bacterium]|nr:DUF3467 domain-containing protein [Burkholderiales bacterium]
MTQESQHAARLATPGALPGSAPGWDNTAAVSSYCTIANATSAERAVVLHFGVPEAHHDAAGELAVRAVHRIALSPVAAQRLQQLLERVIAEYQAR